MIFFTPSVVIDYENGDDKRIATFINYIKFEYRSTWAVNQDPPPEF